jgi:hypothetical protein
MNQEVIIVDGLYDIAHQYHKGFFENECIISDETRGKISQILGNKIEILEASNEVLSEDKSSGVCAHLGCDWIAVIYLSLPLTSFGELGLKFYSHIGTGLETFPTEEELKVYDISNDKLSEVFHSDLSLWKEYGSIPAKYNRMILFRGNRWHSYGKGYGDTLNTSMLYQKIIIKNG